MASGSAMRPIPCSPDATSPCTGPTSVTRSVRRQRRHVAPRRRVIPHARVHRGRDRDRAARAQGHRRDEVVGAAVREAREEVRRRRDDGHEIRALRDAHVQLPRKGRVPHVHRHRLAADARERHRPDEARRRGRHHGQHLGPGLDEQRAPAPPPCTPRCSRSRTARRCDRRAPPACLRLPRPRYVAGRAGSVDSFARTLAL